MGFYLVIGGAKSVAEFSGGAIVGIGEGAWGTVKGLGSLAWGLVSNSPVENGIKAAIAVRGVGSAVYNYDKTWSAITTSVSQGYTEFVNADAYGKGKTTGHVLEAVAEIFVPAGMVTKIIPFPVRKSRIWEVGNYNKMHGVEAGLDAHHVGQKALMEKFAKADNYDWYRAPSILVPKVGHTIKKRSLPAGRQTVSRSTEGIDNARDLLARDIRELRRVYGNEGIPRSSLEKLIHENKTRYPRAFEKKINKN